MDGFFRAHILARKCIIHKIIVPFELENYPASCVPHAHAGLILPR